MLDGDVADRFRLLGADEEPIPIVAFDGGGRNASGSRPLAGGRSRVYAVSEVAAAATLVLLRGETEVRRVPLYLRPGTVNVVR